MRSDKLLKELEMEDTFFPASRIGKSSPFWVVKGKPVFNPGHGSSTRVCLNLDTKKLESKSCRLKVVLVSQKVNIEK
jgi:hypothetical protein